MTYQIHEGFRHPSQIITSAKDRFSPWWETVKGDWDSTTYCGFDAYFGLCQIRRGGVVRVGDQDLSLGVIGTDPNDEKG